MAGGPSRQESHKLIPFKLIHFRSAVMNPRASTSQRRTGAYLRNEDKVRVFFFLALFPPLFQQTSAALLIKFVGVFFYDLTIHSEMKVSLFLFIARLKTPSGGGIVWKFLR